MVFTLLWRYLARNSVILHCSFSVAAIRCHGLISCSCCDHKENVCVLGRPFRVDTIDVYRQVTHSMSIGAFYDKMVDKERPRLYNILSLEFSQNEKYVEATFNFWCCFSSDTHLDNGARIL